MIELETRIRIRRAAEDVFDFVSDPRTFPSWNSAVTAVSLISTGGTDGVGATYSMARRLPAGDVENVLEVVSRERPRCFGIRTISGPTPLTYEFRFAAEGSETIIDVVLRVQLGGVASVLAPIAGLAVQRGVEDNLSALRTLLEAADGPAVPS
jgi:carbon monoxide dehydrogenase subunit G